MKIKPSPKKSGVLLELDSKEKRIPAEPFPHAPAFKLETVLVPVDFSQCSRKALQYAVPFARQFGAELKLLHVFEPYNGASEFVPLGLKSAADAEAELLAELLALRETIPDTIRCSTALRTGEPCTEIARFAQELSVDLIVISTHGRRGLNRMVFGSITEKVVRYAPCPVLIVRESEREFPTEIPGSSPEDHRPEK